MYLLPGIAIYSVDKLMALYAYHKSEPVATRLLSMNVLEVSFETSPRVTYEAGAYVLLNVPSISFLEWHPFSITSAPSVHGNKVFFHVKNAGAWTEQVIEEATTGSGYLRVRLDGFYGLNNGLCEVGANKDGMILVGGGIGVTPMLSLGLEMAKLKRIPVTIVWVVRTVEEFSIFSTGMQFCNLMYTLQFNAITVLTASGVLNLTYRTHKGST